MKFFENKKPKRLTFFRRKRVAQLAIFLGLFLALLACQDNKGADAPAVEIEIKALDGGNTNNASDIFVRMILRTEALEKLRLFLVPSAANISLDDIKDLGPEFYQEFNNIRKNGLILTDLKENLLDINGATIKSGNSYQLRLVLVEDTRSFLLDDAAPLNLTDDNPLIGRYTGLWNDKIYTNFGVSIEILSGDENSAEGVLYYSAAFTPCCSNTNNDGTIEFTFDPETKIIEAFFYHQRLANYLGGVCNATYPGSGKIEGLDLSINFTGEDCDGDHGNGLISLDRLWE